MQREDIEFKTECGQTWRLQFEKPEYKAYVFVRGRWRYMYLGSAIPEPLKQYILKKYKDKKVR